MSPGHRSHPRPGQGPVPPPVPLALEAGPMTTQPCLTCSRRATPGYRTCTPCADTLRDHLHQIATLHTALTDDDALLPTAAPGGRRGPGYTSRSPARDHLIAMTDPRTVWTSTDRLHNPLEVVESWARMVREDTGEAPPATPATIHTETALLIRRLDWITRQNWVDDFAGEVREVHAQLAALDGGHGPTPVGHCPTLLDDGTTCATTLYAPPHGDTIRCHRCNWSWPRQQWLGLGRRMGVTA